MAPHPEPEPSICPCPWLEALVPQGHIYRHLKAKPDLSFARD
jgi:hypothetical protein